MVVVCRREKGPGMGALPFGLLIAALLVFLMSSRQLPLWLRALILLAGVALLVWAGVIVASIEGHYGLFRVVGDLWSHRGDPSNSVLAIALGRNEGSVERHVLPLLDLFFIFVAFLGFAATFALTPGEGLERIVRPLVFATLGAMLGAWTALSLVAVGFGGPVDQREYANLVHRRDVYDGDTFWLGETSLRLYGVDAPERTQPCSSSEPCGARSQDYLADLLDGALVRCAVRERPNGDVTESFGRPLVQCRARTQAGEFDIGERMIRDGYAVIYRSAHPDEYENIVASSGHGLLGLCWLHPTDWRRDRAAREAFLAGHHEGLDLIGAGCPSSPSLPNSDNPR